MKQINIKELKKQINYNYGSTALIKLEGVINTRMKIKNIEIGTDKNYIIIFDKKDRTKNILLNRHQIMKIEETINETYDIKFDLMQDVKIIIKN